MQQPPFAIMCNYSILLCRSARSCNFLLSLSGSQNRMTSQHRIQPRAAERRGMDILTAFSLQ